MGWDLRVPAVEAPTKLVCLDLVSWRMPGSVSLVSVWSGLAEHLAAAPEPAPLAWAGRWPRILPFAAMAFGRWRRLRVVCGLWASSSVG